ncbi:sialidase family protein [Nocardioides sp.]|uniref:sialidase family protein n=1 Tax=Nocardioides sp. TaxID=35761 RepID=UPI00286E8AFF|nr:sialidase family protein [Nocardioides sp.]
MSSSPAARPLRRAALGLATAGVLLLAPALASAATWTDVQANDPQVAGQPTSDADALFPTNKQNEPTIAINPVDGRFLIAGSNDEQRQPPCGPGPVRGPNAAPSDCSFFPNVGTSGVYTSGDGGQTWTNRGLLDDQASWLSSPLVSDGDPVIMYGPRPDSSGRFSYANGTRAYYATLASYKDNVGPYPANKAPEFLAVSFSDDNGASWSRPVIATPNHPVNFNDKEWIAVDDNPGSRFFGRLYMSWTQFRSSTATGNGNEPVQAVYSADGGSTFSAPRQLSPAGNNGTGNGRQGSYVVTGPDGSVYVAFEQGSSQVVAISRDGGVSYARPATIGPVTDIADPIPGANFRTNSFPTLAADPRQGSTTLYAAWSTRTASGGRIVVSTSTDKGVSWSAPATVSTAAEGYAFYQGMDVAPNGRVDLGYQALRAVSTTTYGTGNAAIDSYYLSRSGTTWSAPTKVSSASTDPAASAQNNLARQFMGDYNQLVSRNGGAWFIYTDTRNGVGCPAVDQYQRIIDGTATVRGDFGDRLQTRLGQNPYSHEPGSKPAPPEHCAGSFGNSDAYVSLITP